MKTKITYLGKVSVTAEGEWNIEKDYPRLGIVYTEDYSYLSKKDVPAGTEITDEEYWQMLSNVSGKGPKGDTGEKGETGNTPQLRVNEDNEWEISIDNGESWTNTHVTATGEQGEKGDKGDKGDRGLKGDKGDQGNSGYTGAANELEIVNNVTDTRTTKYTINKTITPNALFRAYGSVFRIIAKNNFTGISRTFTDFETQMLNERDLDSEGDTESISSLSSWIGASCTFSYSTGNITIRSNNLQLPFDYTVVIYDDGGDIESDLQIYPETRIYVEEKAAALSSTMGKKLYERHQVVTEEEFEALRNTDQLQEDVFYYITEEEIS